MDLDQLHTFLEIVRLKSFSKAALSCYRTQPAVSAQVRQLEQELNTSLFERLGTKIALTPAGRIFAEHSAQILDLRRQAQDQINELDRVPRGELLIAANEATCIYVLPKVFSEFKKQFPNVQLLVDRSYGSRVVEAVVENQADFGITQLPVTEKRLQVVKIHSDEIKVLLPAGHPLALQDRIMPGDLRGVPLLLPKAGTTRNRLGAWLEPVEDELNVSMEAGLLAVASMGPEPMVRQLALTYRKDKALSKAALGFIEVTMKHAVPDMGIRAPARPGSDRLKAGIA
jgi:DNA-binding transcriptional LysR family regulator